MTGRYEGGGEVKAGELVALDGIEDPGLAVAIQRVSQGLDGEPASRVLDNREARAGGCGYCNQTACDLLTVIGAIDGMP